MLSTILYFAALFVAKVLDNACGTAKTILIQRNRCVLAGLALACSTLVYFIITKFVVEADGYGTLIVVSVASGVGCILTMWVSNKLSKDKTYVNVIMSDNLEEMKRLRDFLVEHKITNVATDSYTRDWSNKTLTITAYAETKEQSSLIDHYIHKSDTKFKRVVQNKRVR